MTMMKKIYIVLTALLLTITVLPQNVFAEEETGQSPEEITEITEDQTEEETVSDEEEEPVIEETPEPGETEAIEEEPEETPAEIIPEESVIEEEEVPEEEIISEEEPVIEETPVPEETEVIEEELEEAPAEIIPEEPVPEEKEVPEEEIISEEEPMIEETEVIEEEPEETPAQIIPEEPVPEEEVPEEEPVIEETPESEETEAIEEETETQPEEIIEETAEEETEAEAANDVYGDFQYTGTGSLITITRYAGADTDVVVPSEIGGVPVRKIGEYAFEGCESVRNVTIPDSISYIGNYAFCGCSRLRSLTIPDSVSYIGQYAVGYVYESGEPVRYDKFKIYGYKNSTAESYADENGFVFCCLYGDFAYRRNESGMAIDKYLGTSHNAIIPYDVFGFPVTEIGGSAFMDCETLFSVTIPDSVTSIGNYAFENCTSLRSITIPDSVTSIGAYAFAYCRILTKAVLPAGLTRIEDGLFNSCSALWDITIPDSVTSIGDSVFYNCFELTGMDIPDSVTEIGGRLFYGCRNLENVSLPERINSFGYNAFYECRKLKSIRLPEGLEAISGQMFGYCSSLTSVVIPSGVKTIQYSVFTGCSNLTSVTIPDTVTVIGESAFYGCTKLKKVTIPANLTSLGYQAFYNCASLTGISIPASVTSIGFNTFYGCTAIKTAGAIGSGADYEFGWKTEIPSNAFSGLSSLTSFTIPKTVTHIGDYAFYSCRGIKKITVPESVFYIGSYALGYTAPTEYGNPMETVDGFTVCGFAGSAAEDYAQKFDFVFKKIIPSNAFSVSAKTYTGKAIKPDVSITINDLLLTQGTDYTVAYSNNTNAGTATVTVTGKGDYTGTVKKTFKINKADQAVTAKAGASVLLPSGTTTVSVTGVKTSAAYTSSDATVAAVSAAGKITAKKVGTAKITVTAAESANYKKKTVTLTVKVVPPATSAVTAENRAGGIMVSWKAVKGAEGYYIYRNGKLAKTVKNGTTVSWADTKATSNGIKYTYKIIAYAASGKSTKSKSVVLYRLSRPAVTSLKNSKAGKLTVKWKKNEAATGYEIQYSRSAKFAASKTDTITITSRATLSKIINALTKGRTYYVRIRTYKTVKGTKYYSMWSGAKSLKLTK